MMRRLLATVLSVLLVCPLQAAETAAEFLKIGGGARGLGMGGAGTALSKDGTGGLWNPASVGGLDRHEVSFVGARWFEEFQYQALSYAFPLTRRWDAALGATRLARNDIQGFDDGGQATESLDVTNMAVSASMVADVGPWIGQDVDRAFFGITGKYLREDLAAAQASGFAFDAGWQQVIYRRPDRLFLDRVQMGASVLNAGPALTFDEEENGLPLTYRAGLSGRFWARSLTAAVDYEKPKGDPGSVRSGLEYQAAPSLALRGGYRWALKDNRRTLQNGLHLGLGFQVGDFAIDYAYVPFSRVDDTHFLGVRIAFGRSIRLEQVEQRMLEHYQAAQRAYLRRDFAQAHRRLNLILAVDPSHDGARRLMAENRKQLDTLQTDRLLTLGRRQMARGDFAQAQEQFQAVLAISPNHAEAKALLKETGGLLEEQQKERRDVLWRQGEEFFKGHNYAAAIDLWEKVLLLDPGHEAAQNGLVQARQKLEEQRAAARAAAERQQLEKGWAYMNQKSPNPAKAKEVAEEVLKANPESEAARLLLAQANGRLADGLLAEGRKAIQAGQTVKAHAALKKALALDPENKIVADLLEKTRGEIVRSGTEEALNLYSQQKYKEALEKFNYLVEVDPKSADLDKYRQETIRKLGETRRVEAEIFNKEGLKAYDAGNYREAIKNWKRALEIYPDHISARKNLERARQQLKE